jgi:hypothetical protein
MKQDRQNCLLVPSPMSKRGDVTDVFRNSIDHFHFPVLILKLYTLARGIPLTGGEWVPK